MSAQVVQVSYKHTNSLLLDPAFPTFKNLSSYRKYKHPLFQPGSFSACRQPPVYHFVFIRIDCFSKQGCGRFYGIAVFFCKVHFVFSPHIVRCSTNQHPMYSWSAKRSAQRTENSDDRLSTPCIGHLDPQL